MISSLYYRFPNLYELSFKFPPQGIWRKKSYNSFLKLIQNPAEPFIYSQPTARASGIQHPASSISPARRSSESEGGNPASRIPHPASRIQKGLEVGCGAGVLSSALVKTLPGLSLTSIDLSPQMIRFAKKKNSHPRIQYLQGNFFKQKGTYDLFISSYAWVYFPLLDSVMKLSSLLRPSGRFLILNVGKTPFTQIHSTVLSKIHRVPIYLHHPQVFLRALKRSGLTAKWQLIDSFEGSYLIFGQKGNF
jgi:SAM-dependent methyltransferase